jgi:hypothetical protein
MYKLSVDTLYGGEGFIVYLDTSTGPQLKDDPDAFFDHHFPRDNEQMFINNDDRQRFIKLYDQDMKWPEAYQLIEKMYYTEWEIPEESDD